MRKRTSTQQLQDAITNDLLQIMKADVYYKTSRRTETIDVERFQENFDFLCESGVFAETIGWHYGYDCESNIYILETGRMNPHSEIIITVYLRVNDGVKVEDIERKLLFVEEE